MFKVAIKLKKYSLGEEIFSSVTHGVGALMAIAATVLVIVMAAIRGNTMGVVGGSIYGGTMIVLYTMSTLYHSITNQTAKKVFRVIDHCSIFLLIAGTYTPYCLCTLWGHGGLGILIAIWTCAIMGIVMNAVALEKFKNFSLILYVVMGLAILFKLPTLITLMPFGGLVFMCIAGGVYILGIIFYKLKIKYMHAIWHLFVLAGSICFFFSILFYVV
ncbi:MAG: hemolysin III family protein [Clostridia bacterium]|nr:hemolysin III family protein [Clostridia bacterium]